MAKVKKKYINKLTNVEETKDKELFNYVLVISFFLFLVFFTTFKITGDDDVFWHLATGRYVLQTHQVPSTDIFGYATQGMPWMPFEWGWDVITYILHSSTGYIGLSIFRTILLIIIFLVYLIILRRLKISYTISILFLFILLFSMIDRLTPRPHLISYLFFALTLLVIINFRYINRTKTKYLYFLPLIFFLWANMHMGIIAGLLLIGIYFASELITYFFPGKFSSKEIQPLSKPELVRLLLIFTACVLVMLINPNGFQTYIYAYEHTKMKMLETVNEWVSPFSEKYTDNIVSYIYKAFLFTGFLTIFYSFSKKDILPGLLYVIFGLYSVRAMRFTVDYVLILFPFIMLTFYFFILKIKSVSFKNLIINNTVPKVLFSAVFILLIFPVNNNSLYLSFLKYYRISGFGINSDFIPTQMFDFIRENKITEIGEKPFNHFGTGGFLIYNFPKAKNFIDSRNLNDEIFSEYNSIITKKPGFEKKIKDHDFDYILYLAPDLIRMPQEMEQTIISYLSKNTDEWKLVFWDDKSFLYVKNIPKFQDIINKYEYKYLNQYNYYYQNNVVEKSFRENKDRVKMEAQRKLNEDSQGFIINSLISKFKLL